MMLSNLNWNALISRACDVGERSILRWRAYRLALHSFDWYYRASTSESYWRDHEHKYIMLAKARDVLYQIDAGRAMKMWYKAASPSGGK